MSERSDRGRFANGHKGIGGRPPLTKEQREAREELNRLTPKAVRILNELMDDSDPDVRFKAAKAVLDKGVPDALDGDALSEMNPFKGMERAHLIALAKSRMEKK